MFNISWNDDEGTKQSKDLKKSFSTIEKNTMRKNKVVQEKKLLEKHKKEIDFVIKCEKCNLKVNSKKAVKITQA